MAAFWVGTTLKIVDKALGIWKSILKNREWNKYVDKLEKINEMEAGHDIEKLEPKTDEEWDIYFRTGQRPTLPRVRDDDHDGEVPKVGKT